MFEFSIKSNLEGVEQLYLRTNNGQREPTEILAGDIDMDTIDGIHQIIMVWYPGEAFVLTLNGDEYDVTNNLPDGVRAAAIPGIWDVRSEERSVGDALMVGSG